MVLLRLLAALLCLFVVASGTSSAQTTDGDFVRFNNGKESHGRTQLREMAGGTALLLDGEAVDQAAVRAFMVGGRYYIVHHELSVAGTRSLQIKLLERVAEGRLSLYRPYDPLRSTSTSYTHFQKGTAPVRPVSYQYLEEAVRDNPASMTHLEASQRWRRVRTLLLIAGSGIIVYGGYKSFKPSYNASAADPIDNFTLHAGLPVGVAVTLSSLIPNRLRHAHFREALEAYNR